jgi:effector protein SdbA
MLPTTHDAWKHCKKPLIIASSGGGGHISAAQSLISQLQLNPNHILTHHQYQKPSSGLVSFENGIQLGCHLYHIPGWQYLIQKLTGVHLPSPLELQEEMDKLLQQNTAEKLYLDFMLDIVPNGYAFTALFNYLQKTADAKSLNQVVSQQCFLDAFYKKQIIRTIYHLLVESLKQGQGYDSILSTQPIGMAAICQAVAKYNKSRAQLSHQFQQEIPEILIHQFVTDIPHQGAIHFLKPLNGLDYLQKKFLVLHMLNLNEDNIFLEKKHANKIFRYHPEENPIVRQQFIKHAPCCKNSMKYLNLNQQTIAIKTHEKLALIMLGAANGQTCLAYLKSLVELNIQHIIVIGQVSPKDYTQIQQLRSTYSQIYLPGFVNANQLSDILKNVNIIISKGGGLSLMELAGFNLAQDTIIAIHHPLNQPGLIWEDGNIDWFIKFNQEQRRHVFTTQPENLGKQLLATNFVLPIQTPNPSPQGNQQAYAKDY